MKAVIFDLDQTLIDSKPAKTLRQQRQWSEVYKMVSSLTPYKGMSELISDLKIHGYKIAVVTTSPRPYCQNVLNYWQWKFDAVVCYHDTLRRKPNPDPIMRALEILEVTNKEAISLGDSAADIIASKAAGVISGACLWDADDRISLLNTKPDLFFDSISQLRGYLFN